MEEQKKREEPKIKKTKTVTVSTGRKNQFKEILANVFAAAHTDTIDYPDLIGKINRYYLKGLNETNKLFTVVYWRRSSSAKTRWRRV